MATNYSAKTLTWGVPTLTGYVVQSYDKENISANVTELYDENGNRFFARYDDLTKTVTLEVIVENATTLPVPGATVTYDGTEYEVLSVSEKRVNKGDAKKATFKLKTSEGVTL